MWKLALERERRGVLWAERKGEWVDLGNSFIARQSADLLKVSNNEFTVRSVSMAMFFSSHVKLHGCRHRVKSKRS